MKIIKQKIKWIKFINAGGKKKATGQLNLYGEKQIQERKAGRILK